MITHNIRPITPADLPALIEIVNSTELFPGEMLEEMTSPFFSGQDQSVWLTYEVKGIPVSVTFCAPEQMTEGTWNLYLIAVHTNYQGKGIGAALMNFIEAKLKMQEQRILLVETSGLDEFARTRNFYAKLAYTEEARIREFYAPGEDKIVFWKKL